jgi:hypothetical protein
MDLTFISGLNLQEIQLLPKSKSSKRINDEYVGFAMGKIPTYIEICPKCDSEVKWRTTGTLPDSLVCEKCGQRFGL